MDILDLVIIANTQIISTYQEYKKCGTILTLKNDLFRLYKI
jgi:hypothetical protein